MISSSPRGERLEVCGDVEHAVVVEIEPGHRPMRFRLFRLLHDANRFAGIVELDDAVALRIVHQIREHGAAGGARHGPLQHWGQAGAVEHVVAEDEGAAVSTDELPPDDESLGESFRLRLRRIGKIHADAAAVAKETHEAILVLRRRHDQHFADAGEHQHRKRIVDQRLVVDGHQLLAGGDGDGIEPRA